MGRWESLIDKNIREAMEHGEFDDLAGKRQPIDLRENPYEDPDWRTAHRLLRNAGFAPAWMLAVEPKILHEKIWVMKKRRPEIACRMTLSFCCSP